LELELLVDSGKEILLNAKQQFQQQQNRPKLVASCDTRSGNEVGFLHQFSQKSHLQPEFDMVPFFQTKSDPIHK